MASIVKVDKIAQASGTPEFTIPTADGAANTFLKTDGSGVLSFGAVTTCVFSVLKKLELLVCYGFLLLVRFYESKINRVVCS